MRAMIGGKSSKTRSSGPKGSSGPTDHLGRRIKKPKQQSPTPDAVQNEAADVKLEEQHPVWIALVFIADFISVSWENVSKSPRACAACCMTTMRCVVAPAHVLIRSACHWVHFMMHLCCTALQFFILARPISHARPSPCMPILVAGHIPHFRALQALFIVTHTSEVLE